MQASLTLTNVEIQCSENSYVLIKDQYYLIKTDGTIEYNEEKYPIDTINNWVILDKETIDVHITDTVIDNIKQYKGTIEIDPSASLTLDIQYRHLNDKKGGVKGFTLSNESEIEQNIKVLIKQLDNDNIGTFDVTLL